MSARAAPRESDITRADAIKISADMVELEYWRHLHSGDMTEHTFIIRRLREEAEAGVNRLYNERGIA